MVRVRARVMGLCHYGEGKSLGFGLYWMNQRTRIGRYLESGVAPR